MAVMFGGIADFGFLKLHAAFKHGTFLANYYKMSITLSTSSQKPGHLRGKYPRNAELPTHGEGCKRDGDEVISIVVAGGASTT